MPRDPASFVIDHDVIVAPGERHLLRDRVHARAHPEAAPVGVGAQRLVAVARMDVDEVIGAVDDLPGDHRGDALRDGPVRFPRVDAIQVRPIERTVVNGAAEERRHVGDVDEQQRALELGGIDLGTQALQCDDRGDLGPVRPRDQRQRGAREAPAHDGDRDAGGGVNARRDLEESRPHLTSAGGDGTDGEGGLLCRGNGPRQKHETGDEDGAHADQFGGDGAARLGCFTSRPAV